MTIRRIRGTVVLPETAPRTTATMTIDVRDTSLADAAAPLVAATTFPDTVIGPGGRLPFIMEAPEVAAGQHLSLRCHIDHGGVLLSTESIPVASQGDVDAVVVPVFPI